MKFLVKFFRTLGDVLGLAILLGGLLLATNNVAAKRAVAIRPRAVPEKASAPAAGRQARAAA